MQNHPEPDIHGNDLRFLQLTPDACPLRACQDDSGHDSPPDSPVGRAPIAPLPTLDGGSPMTPRKARACGLLGPLPERVAIPTGALCSVLADRCIAMPVTNSWTDQNSSLYRVPSIRPVRRFVHWVYLDTQWIFSIQQQATNDTMQVSSGSAAITSLKQRQPGASLLTPPAIPHTTANQLTLQLEYLIHAPVQPRLPNRWAGTCRPQTARAARSASASIRPAP